MGASTTEREERHGSLIDLITIDPGVRHFATAAWNGDRLVGAVYWSELLPLVLTDSRLTCADYLYREAYRMKSEGAEPYWLIEVPKVYDAQHQKGDQKDIRDLALVVGSMGGALRALTTKSVNFVEPREWKGTVKKQVMLARILDKLSGDERQLLPQSLTSALRTGKGPGADLLDAVGIGLWKVGRLMTRRTR